ncbi:MAG: hypothetical protein HQ500_05595 [Flavobacteriales bacterium]|nr:hypothetical protein [Flavobacteriales bacterium]
MRRKLVYASAVLLVMTSVVTTSYAQSDVALLTLHEQASEQVAPPTKIDFEAHRVGADVELKWVVSGFIKYFSLERSLDRTEWEPVLHMTGSNQTYHKTEYFDIDYNVPSSKLFYRVNHVLYSGESTTSNVFYVPPYDDLTSFEERMIKTISDPIQEGMRISLSFVNFEAEDLLLVMRDQCGIEFYAKVKYIKEEQTYMVTDVSGDIPSGQYLITASSKKHVYSSKLRIELTD